MSFLILDYLKRIKTPFPLDEFSGLLVSYEELWIVKKVPQYKFLYNF